MVGHGQSMLMILVDDPSLWRAADIDLDDAAAGGWCGGCKYVP